MTRAVASWRYASPMERQQLEEQGAAHLAAQQQPEPAPFEAAPQPDEFSGLGPYADLVRRASMSTPGSAPASSLAASTGGGGFFGGINRIASIGQDLVRAKASQQPHDSGGFLDHLGSALSDVGSVVGDASPMGMLENLRHPARSLADLRDAAGSTLGAVQDAGHHVAGPVLNSFLDQSGNLDLNPFEVAKNVGRAELQANPISRLGEGLLHRENPYGGHAAAGYERFQASDAPSGLKTTASILSDPTTYLGPGAVSKLGPLGHLIGQPLEAGVGGALGAGAATQIADSSGAPGWAQMLAPFAGGGVGGLAGGHFAGTVDLAKQAEHALSGERGSMQADFGLGDLFKRKSGEPSIQEPTSSGGAGTVSSPVPPALGSASTDASAAAVADPTFTPPPGSSAAAPVAPLASEALAAKAATVRTPEGGLLNIPLFRKGAALFNPSIDQDPTVHIAHLAQVGVRSSELTMANAVLKPLADDVATAMKETPAHYIGPANNTIAGTFKDIADHPDFYVIPPRLQEAIAKWGDANEAVTARMAAGYGVDSGLYHSEVPGAVYAPTVPTAASVEERIAAAGGPSGRSSLSGSARTQERSYAGAYERMQADPSFKPVTDVHELTAIHNNAMAQNAANETFRAGAGGKTKLELMAETHPKLVEMKNEALKSVASLRNRLATVEARSATTGRVSDELSTALEKVRNAAPDEDISPLETALRNGGRRLDQLLSRREITNEQAAALRGQLASATDKLAEVRDAWRTADPTRGTDYQLSQSTYRYHPAAQIKTINEITKSPSGFGKGIIDAMDEVRAWHLSLDGSPISIQGVLGLFQDPIIALKSARDILGRNPQAELRRIIQEEPETVRAYTFATGRQFGQPIAEFSPPKGTARIKGVKAVEDQMFAAVQHQGYQQWKNDVALIQKWNPEMSATVAQHEAANLLSKTVPSLNPAERGLSPLRAGVERAALTSTSFAASPALLVKDMTSGLAKLVSSKTLNPQTAWRTLDGREQLALLRGSYIAGSILSLSAASAAASASSRGMSAVDAVKEAMDPRSRYFAAIQVGGGHSIAIGGPFRSFVKAIAPAPGSEVPGTGLAKYAYGKLNSPISGSLNLLRDQDFKGDSIKGHGSAAEQILRSVAYGFEQVAPTTIGAASAGIRTGASPVTTATDVGGQFLGANPSIASASESLNQVARDYPGSNGKDFFNLEPHQQDELKKLHPDLYRQYLASSSDQRQQADATRTTLQTQQQASDDQLLAGQLSPKDWKDQQTARRNQLKGAEDIIYANKKVKAPTDPAAIEGFIKAGPTPRDRYMRAIDSFTDATGTPDWDKVDQWTAAQPKADQEYVDRNTGLAGTPIEKLRRQLSREYYALPTIRGHSADEAFALSDLMAKVNNTAGKGASDVKQLQALRKVAGADGTDKKLEQLARQHILGRLKVDPSRDRYKAKHPEVALLTAQAPLTSQQVAAVRAKLS